MDAKCDFAKGIPKYYYVSRYKCLVLETMFGNTETNCMNKIQYIGITNDINKSWQRASALLLSLTTGLESPVPE